MSIKIEDMQSAATTNERVMLAFIAGAPAHSGNLSTDGEVLRSYHYYELARWNGDKVTLRAGELYSNTTKKHHTQLRKLLDNRKVSYDISTIETPREEKHMLYIDSRATEENTPENLSVDEYEDIIN